MTASRSDQSFLANDLLFQGRVRAALAFACVAIWNEAVGTPFHFQRVRQAVTILNSIELSSGNMPPWVLRFTVAVATDAGVIGDATTGGTVVLNSGNIDAQQAFVTDAHIDTAISNQFNSFFYPA